MSNLASVNAGKTIKTWQPDAASLAALVDRSSCPGEICPRRQHQPGAKGIVMRCPVPGFFIPTFEGNSGRFPQNVRNMLTKLELLCASI